MGRVDEVDIRVDEPCQGRLASVLNGVARRCRMFQRRLGPERGQQIDRRMFDKVFTQRKQFPGPTSAGASGLAHWTKTLDEAAPWPVIWSGRVRPFPLLPIEVPSMAAIRDQP